MQRSVRLHLFCNHSHTVDRVAERTVDDGQFCLLGITLGFWICRMVFIIALAILMLATVFGNLTASLQMNSDMRIAAVLVCYKRH